MKIPFRYVYLLSALMIGCSSDSDTSNETFAPEDQTPGGETSVMNAGNFEPILSQSMDLLRTDFYNQADLLLDQLDDLWQEDQNIDVGNTTSYDCEGGGTISRVLSQQISLEENRRVGELQLSNCAIAGATLNGLIGIDEEGAPLTSLGDGSKTLTLNFNELSIVQADSSEVITGTYAQYSDNMSGFSTTSSTTDLYQRTEGSNTVSLSNASYSHHFEYVREQNTVDGGDELIRWMYTETGYGTLSISALGLVDASLSIDPELVYINKPEEQIPNYTDTLTSGALELSVPAGGQLNAEVASLENGTVLYTLTDENGEVTPIEREWLSPAPL